MAGKSYNRASENLYAVATAKTGKRCFLCGVNFGVYRHHIKPKIQGGTSDRRNIINLCEDCHNRVEEQPESLTPNEKKICKLIKDGQDYPQEWIIHRDGQIIWLGTRHAWGMDYKLVEINWSDLQRMV